MLLIIYVNLREPFLTMFYQQLSIACYQVAFDATCKNNSE